MRRGEIVRSVDDMYQKALDLYDARWSPIGFSSKDEEKTRYEDGKRILRGFLEFDVSRKAEVVDIEKQFNFNLVPDLRIGGRIDRIDRLPSGHLEIIDYKTGQLPERKELETGTKGLQLSIYALAATNKDVLGADLAKLIFSFHYLEAGERISIERTEDDLREAKATILEVREQIEHSDFECSNSRVCQLGCDYKLFCG
jgi:DNA helicase-2/ATP-dependent DNA helicase PcrA